MEKYECAWNLSHLTFSQWHYNYDGKESNSESF